MWAGAAPAIAARCAISAPAPSLDAGRGVPVPGLALRSARPARYRRGHVAASSSAARSPWLV
jgi:hypothetical protein